jgi:hypothetical protein
MIDGNIRNWSTLEQLQKVDVDVFVPGLRPPMNQSDVKTLHQSISTFYSRVNEGVLKGLTELEIRSSLYLSDWQRLERLNMIGRNINRAYREIKNDNL